MKGLGEFLRFHLIPAGLAGVVLLFGAWLFLAIMKLLGNPVSDTTVITHQQDRQKEGFSNCEGGNKDEAELAALFKNKRMITVLGSSELTNRSNYLPFIFLPDSLNTPTVGYGHAFHQSFSMYCELLALDEFVEGSQICIMVSPGWFTTEGTNIEAFLEFVRPHFLQSIAHNPHIDTKDKLEVARYIFEHRNQIAEPGHTLLHYINLYRMRNVPLYTSFAETIYNLSGNNIKYEVSITPISALNDTVAMPWEKRMKTVQAQFVSGIKNNNLYVSDTYYTEHLIGEDGKQYVPATNVLPAPDQNRELADFKLLVNQLKKKNVQASFVIQPLNPYYYNDLDNYIATISEVEKTINNSGYPYLNLFVTQKADYEPGTLQDVMHMGDYGWLKVNRFIKEQYPYTHD